MKNYNKLGMILGLTLIFFSILIGSMSLYLMNYNKSFFLEWVIISLNSVEIIMTLYLDMMSSIFMSLVLFISGLIMVYSDQYMESEKYIIRFLMMVLLFVISMMFLVISPNLISILLGWDGLGLVSYCLVIYYQNMKSYNAGMITALSNRIGDVMILMAITYMFSIGSWNFSFMLNKEQFNYWEVYMMMLLLMIAAMTKSAQIPFSAWLPAAMAAPTPVSSLVHSSTLVTAGVYLLIRFNKLLMFTELSKFMFVIASFTMLMAGIGANFEMDLKKIIALSTLSQLGLMMSILSLGYPMLAFFHLLTHAMFKALLFMCAGNFIHSLKNNQDIRYMGGLSINMPITASCFLVANMALCGMPFLAGFYSKDMILESSMQYLYSYWGIFAFYISTGATACYSVRLAKVTLMSNYSGSPYNNWGEENWVMVIPMMILTVLAVFGGCILSWYLIEPLPVFVTLSQKYLIYFTIILGSFMGWFMKINSLYPSKFNKFINFFLSMSYMPMISSNGVISFPLNLGAKFMKTFDQGWSELMGPQGLFFLLSMMSKYLENWQMTAMKTMFFLISLLLMLIIIM